MAGHHVDLPWWCDSGRFVDEFLNYLRSKKSSQLESACVANRRWIYVVLDPANPERSRVQFGMVRSQAATKAYAWAYDEWLLEGARLLSGFVTEWSSRAGGWGMVRMHRKPCPSTGQTFFACPEDESLSFVQAPGADDSECGCWSLLQS